VRQGAVICPSMAKSLVRGFGMMFLPLRQPTVKWRIALFTRRRTSLSPAVESFPNSTLDFTPNRAATGLESRRAAGLHKRAQGVPSATGVCLQNRRCLPD